MGFSNLGTLVDAINNGQYWHTAWRKTPSQITATGIWFDLTMSPGNPAPFYYAATPLQANLMTGTGIFQAGAVSPKTKHLKSLSVFTLGATAVPLPLILCDYLLYYPFVDMSVTDEQDMDNTQPLTRYMGGAGVQMMAVEVAAQIGGQTFQVSYTNQAGVAGQVTPTVTCGTGVVNGSIITSDRATAGCMGPFLPLQQGDTGVQSIQSVTMNGADVGLFTLVLVKPLATYMIRGIDAAVEVDFLRDRPSLPRVFDGAYLSHLCLPNGSLQNLSIFGEASFAWS